MTNRLARRGKAAGRQGFALPAMIFALLLMSVLAVVALQTASDDQLSSQAVREGGVALYAAEAGTNWVLSTLDNNVWTTLAPGDSVDLGWQGFGNGSSYHAVLHRYDNDDGRQKVFGLTVDGHGAVPLGGRRVIRLMLTPGAPPGMILNPIASLAPIAGFNSSGGGLLSGSDSTSCPTGTVAGVAAPDGFVTEGGTVVDGPEPWLAGVPPVQWLGTMVGAYAALQLDWALLEQLTPDYSVPRIQNWPDSAAAFGGDQWPMITVTRGSITLKAAQSGQGLLLTDGNLTVESGFEWHGLILVGGGFDTKGVITISGGVVAGLDFIFGGSVNVGDLSGTPLIQFNSCSIQRAGQAAIDKGFPELSGGGAGLTTVSSRAWREVSN